MSRSILSVKSMVVMVALVAMFSSCGGGEKRVAQVRAMKTISVSDSTLSAQIADTINLGRIRTGEIISQTVSLKNDTQKPMLVLDVDTSCGCTSAAYNKMPVKMGEELPLTLNYDSSGLLGSQQKKIVVKTNLSPKPIFIILMAEVELQQE